MKYFYYKIPFPIRCFAVLVLSFFAVNIPILFVYTSFGSFFPFDMFLFQPENMKELRGYSLNGVAVVLLFPIPWFFLYYILVLKAVSYSVQEKWSFVVSAGISGGVLGLLVAYFLENMPFVILNAELADRAFYPAILHFTLSAFVISSIFIYVLTGLEKNEKWADTTKSADLVLFFVSVVKWLFVFWVAITQIFFGGDMSLIGDLHDGREKGIVSDKALNNFVTVGVTYLFSSFIEFIVIKRVREMRNTPKKSKDVSGD